MTSAAADPSSAGVHLVVNGEVMAVPDQTDLDALVDLVGIERRGIAIAVDGNVVPRSQWCTTVPPNGARVEIVTAAAGG
jgi:sulfur carrier protein